MVCFNSEFTERQKWKQWVFLVLLWQESRVYNICITGFFPKDTESHNCFLKFPFHPSHIQILDLLGAYFFWRRWMILISRKGSCWGRGVGPWHVLHLEVMWSASFTSRWSEAFSFSALSFSGLFYGLLLFSGNKGLVSFFCSFVGFVTDFCLQMKLITPFTFCWVWE